MTIYQVGPPDRRDRIVTIENIFVCKVGKFHSNNRKDFGQMYPNPDKDGGLIEWFGATKIEVMLFVIDDDLIELVSTYPIEERLTHPIKEIREQAMLIWERKCF